MADDAYLLGFRRNGLHLGVKIIPLRPDVKDAIGINAIAHFAQIAQDRAAHHETVSRAQVAQIENRLRRSHQARGGVRSEPHALQESWKRLARRDCRFAEQDQLLLHAMSVFARRRRLGHDLVIGGGGAEVIHADDARHSDGEQQNADQNLEFCSHNSLQRIIYEDGSIAQCDAGREVKCCGFVHAGNRRDWRIADALIQKL